MYVETIIKTKKEQEMNNEDISVQLYTTRKFQPYTPILQLLNS